MKSTSFTGSDRLQAEIRKNLRHNFIVNTLDGAFFGHAMGYASLVAVIPLFVSTLTTSTSMIGFIVALHPIGWFLPQLLTANHVAKLRRYKPMVVLLTAHERWPFVGLAIVAWLVPVIGKEVALALTVFLMACQGLGGGLTATAWQSMVSKVVPAERRGTFYGSLSAGASLLGSISVVIAGRILLDLPSPLDFTVCFALCAVFMCISWYFLAQTKEPESEPKEHTVNTWQIFCGHLMVILRRDGNFRWFLVGRMLSQFAVMAVGFYAIFSKNQYGMDEQVIGIMAGLLTVSKMIASPLCGWIGDQWGHQRVFALGMLFAAASAFLVLTGTHVNVLYMAFVLAGAADAVMWATAMTMSSDFGGLEDRPYYIGLANTLIAPAAMIAPVVGGMLADQFGFSATFLLAAVSGLAAAIIMQFALRDPRAVENQVNSQVATAPAGMD
jgi:MFS family permease